MPNHSNPDTDTNTATVHHTLYTILGYTLSAAALGYLIYQLVTYDDYATLGQTLGASQPWMVVCVVAAVALMPLQLVIEARKWQWMVRGLVNQDLATSWRQVLRGYVGAFITPYRLGEYPTRVLEMGYRWEEWKKAVGGWREWLLDWKKWLRVAGWHLARYAVWMLQLGLVLYFVGVTIPVKSMVIAIIAYYAVITLAPSIPSAEVAIKGGWAALIFGQYTDNIPAIAIAVVLIWLINTVLPTIIGVFCPTTSPRYRCKYSPRSR